ncbi:syntaxin-8-like isoform X2 [Physella acuta]|nr:syntaxin-8-like isoform X2 [Physella acuta]
MEQINERNKHARTSAAYTKLSAQIRSRTRQFTSDLNRLKQNLLRASSSYHITQREVERRQGMMDALVTREKQIDQATRNEEQSSVKSVGDRGLLLAGASDRDPWGVRDEPEVFPDMSNTDLHQHQQTVIREQDRGLEALSHVIGRQKQMALDIGNEVDSQNDLLDDIGDHMDTTDTLLQRETRHIRIVDRKSGACCYYIVIMLLFVAIIVIVAVPYKGKP